MATTQIAHSLDFAQQEAPATPMDAQQKRWWDAVISRDTKEDGKFFYGVTTTGVFCRPSCPSRKPLLRNVVFFGKRSQPLKAGFRPCLRCRPLSLLASDENVSLIQQVCAHIEQNGDAPITLGALGKRFYRSPFHLQRTFKAVLGISPREYADSCRMQRFRRGLQAGTSVTTALYEAGFGSSSRVYERATSELGMSPNTYRRGAVACNIDYAMVDSPLGKMLVAATSRGVCSIRFGENEEELEQGIRREFPFAIRKRDEKPLAPYLTSLRNYFAGKRLHPELRLDIQATAFQRRVWDQLRRIPYGTTQSYGEIAHAVGDPKASRAVGTACGSNPVAITIPCHRVLPKRGVKNGSHGGYRWGAARKKALLEMEAGKA